jgi:hypothetical protein
MSHYWYTSLWEYQTNTGLAYTNWQELVEKGFGGSWLRSSEAGDSGSAVILHGDGDVGFGDVTDARGVRPALWVSSEIFE